MVTRLRNRNLRSCCNEMHHVEMWCCKCWSNVHVKVARLFSTTFAGPSVPHQLITMLRGPPHRHQCSQAKLMCASASSGGHLLPDPKHHSSKQRKTSQASRLAHARPKKQFIRPLDLISSTRYASALLLPVPSTVLHRLRQQ